MSVQNPVRLFVQLLTGTLALYLAFHFGILRGTLAPLVHLDGFGEPIVILLMVLFYLVAVGLVALFATDPSLSSNSSAPVGDDGTGSPARIDWKRISAPDLIGAVFGAVVAGGLVFSVPDWLSTALPLVALSVAAVAFAFAGDAVPIRGLDTAMWSAGATIFLIVLPAALYPVLELATLFLAAVVGIAALLAVRSWLGTHSPIDRRISVSLALVFALVAGGVMAHDLSGSRPVVDLDTDATVNLSAAENQTYALSDEAQDRPMVLVGRVTVRNEFGFARTATLPSYEACLYGADGTRPSQRWALAPVVETDDWFRSVDEVRLPGGTERQFGVVVLLDSIEERSLSEIRDLGTVPVRRADSCPETTDGPALALVPAEENRSLTRPRPHSRPSSGPPSPPG